VKPALLSWLAASMLLAACAAAPPAPSSPELRLALSPASAGRTLALAQSLEAEVGGRRIGVEALLEVDAAHVRLALLQFGRPVARLDWDGVTLHEEREPGVPAQLQAARILSELQMVQWPADAIRAALPPGWTLTETGSGVTRERLLSERGTPLMRVRYPAEDQAELEHLRDGYRLRIVSRPLEAS